MGMFDKIVENLSAKANSLVGRFDDPAEKLDLAYVQQMDLLRELKNGLSTIATERKRLENMKIRYCEDIARLDVQAGQAVDGGNDQLATQILSKKAVIKGQIDALGPQIKGIKANEKQISDRVQQAEAEINKLSIQKETLKAQLQSSEAQARVNEAMAGLGGRGSVDVAGTMNDARSRIDKANARTEAVGELAANGVLTSGVTDPLTQRVDSMTVDAAVSADLARLKAARQKK
jgi:phage shock protein A